MLLTVGTRIAIPGAQQLSGGYMNYMKLYRIILCLATASCLCATASADPSPILTPVNFAKTYIPNGFDSNDNVQFVGEGKFSDSCFRHSETKVRVDQAQKKIFVSPTAFKYPGMCLQVILPFDRVVDVGLVPAGEYSVIQSSTGQSIGQLKVRGATTLEPDDHLYAPVSQAMVYSRESSHKVHLIGEFPLSCMRMKEVKLDVQPNVLVVQPIAELDLSRPCLAGSFSYESQTEVGDMQPGRYLLHVRSMNGKATNTLFDIQ